MALLCVCWQVLAQLKRIKFSQFAFPSGTSAGKQAFVQEVFDAFVQQFGPEVAPAERALPVEATTVVEAAGSGILFQSIGLCVVGAFLAAQQAATLRSSRGLCNVACCRWWASRYESMCTLKSALS